MSFHYSLPQVHPRTCRGATRLWNEESCEEGFRLGGSLALPAYGFARVTVAAMRHRGVRVSQSRPGCRSAGVRQLFLVISNRWVA